MTRRNTLFMFAGLAPAALSGCQAWPQEPGITVPSPYYLRHPPQYFPPSPPYPLPKELDSLERAAKEYYDNPAR